MYKLGYFLCRCVTKGCGKPRDFNPMKKCFEHGRLGKSPKYKMALSMAYPWPYKLSEKWGYLWLGNQLFSAIIPRVQKCLEGWIGFAGAGLGQVGRLDKHG